MAQILGAQGDQEKKKQYIYEAKDLAKTALDLDDQCANAHKWLVFTILAILFFFSKTNQQQNICLGYLHSYHGLHKHFSIIYTSVMLNLIHWTCMWNEIVWTTNGS